MTKSAEKATKVSLTEDLKVFLDGVLTEKQMKAVEGLKEALLMARRLERNDYTPRKEVIKAYEQALDKAGL